MLDIISDEYDWVVHEWKCEKCNIEQMCVECQVRILPRFLLTFISHISFFFLSHLISTIFVVAFVLVRKHIAGKMRYDRKRIFLLPNEIFWLQHSENLWLETKDWFSFFTLFPCGIWCDTFKHLWIKFLGEIISSVWTQMENKNHFLLRIIFNNCCFLRKRTQVWKAIN
jgi:hypothetical protein